MLRRLAGLDPYPDRLPGLHLNRIGMIRVVRQRHFQLVVQRSLLRPNRPLPALQVLASQAAGIVLPRAEDVDAIQRGPRWLVAAFGMLPPAAAAAIAAESSLLDRRIADTELLPGAACRIEPDRHPEPGDLHPRAGV